MKQIIFSNFDDIKNPYYGGGGAVAIHEVAKRLAGDFDVTVITGTYPGSENESLDGVHYKRIGLKSLPPKLGQLLFQILLPIYAVKEKYDVWIESFTPPFSTAFLPLFTKKPIVGLTHLLGGEAMTKKYKLPFYLIERLGLKFYKHCIALSLAIKQKLLSINPNMGVVSIPNGVSNAMLEESSEPKGEYILFIGRIDVNQKGLDTLLDAYKLASSEVSLPLVIAGSGIMSQEELISKRIQELGLENKVSLTGKITGENKNEVFRNSAFIVAPSRDENFPLIVLESFCFRLPIIVSDISGFSWVPSEAAVQFPVGDRQGLSKAIIALSKDTSRRIQMGEAGRNFVKNYSWDNVARQYKEYIKSII